MREQNYISAEEAAEAEPADVKLVPTPKQNSVRYFTTGCCRSSTH
jgi:penicillin-binding protein 1A